MTVSPRLIVITDTRVAAESDLEIRIERVLSAAMPCTVMVQLRDNDLPARARLALGERLRERCRRSDQWFVVNDRIDLAVLLGADGVHLGESSIEPADARRLLSASAWISRACHDPAAAARLDVDGVLLSPIMDARKGRPALGLAALGAARRAAAALPKPADLRLYALGGVRAENAAECITAGADGVAVIGAALDGTDPRPLLGALGILAA